MNRNSIQFRLQLWYGILFALMLAGLGMTAYRLERESILLRVDARLHAHTKLLADALNGPPEAMITAETQGMPVEWYPPQPGSFHLLPRQAREFSADIFYLIRGSDGREIARSANYENRTNGVRLTQITTPTGEMIITGQRLALENAELRRYLWQLIFVGLIILLVGISVGWYLVARVLRPIAMISAAAEKIADGDLSRRINVAETQSELGRLAVVLNTTFARLDAAFHLQRRFAADAAHELRTPVSVLLAQTHAALLKPRSYEENLATIEACHRASLRMKSLIASLLQLARMDAGQEKSKREWFQLLPLVSEAVALVQPLALERGINLAVPTGDAQMFGDPEQWHQVITNLVTNAIQYNRPNGEVRVHITTQAQQVQLAVADTGLGIAAADLPRIFDRFYRADESRSSGNSGLGLSICQAIVAAHGGTITADSDGHTGTTFLVSVPMRWPGQTAL